MNPESPYYYPYVIGGKTGFTTQAKNCMIAMSEKDGLELISIVFHAESAEDGRSARYLDTITLLEYGNNNFMQYAVPKENPEISLTQEKNLENSLPEISNNTQLPNPTEQTPSSFNFKTLFMILLILIGIRILVAFVQHKVILCRISKNKKRARKFLNP